MVHGNPAALTGDAMAYRASRLGAPPVDPGSVRPLNAFERDQDECLPLVKMALRYIVDALSAPSVAAYAARAQDALPKYATVLGTLHLLPTVQIGSRANGHDFWVDLLDHIEQVAGDELAEDIEQSVAVMRRTLRLLQSCAELPVRPGTEVEDARLDREIGGNIAIHAWCTDALFIVATTDKHIAPDVVASIPADLAITARRAYALAMQLLKLRRGEQDDD